MGDISEHFNRSEFACKCGCGFDTIDTETLKVLEEIRAHFNSPVKITSGCRCAAYNKKVGGKKHSQHLRGRAADIQVNGFSSDAVKLYAEFIMHRRGGIGRYNTFTHIDTRTGKARWGDDL